MQNEYRQSNHRTRRLTGDWYTTPTTTTTSTLVTLNIFVKNPWNPSVLVGRAYCGAENDIGQGSNHALVRLKLCLRFNANITRINHRIHHVYYHEKVGIY